MTHPCPRCNTPVDRELYGLCAGCAQELRQNATLQARWRHLLDVLQPGKLTSHSDD